MFVVPVFGKPPWLPRCVESLQAQSISSPIVMTTSTPNQYVIDVANDFGVPLAINPISGGIASDWNFALSQAPGQWVTLAHQDDWFDPHYVAECSSAIEQCERTPILAFSAAREVLAGHPEPLLNTRFKKALCFAAFLGQPAITSRLRRRLLLSFGNPVPCPSAMINLAVLPDFRFPNGWKSNLDWRAWLTLAEQPGAFVYVPRDLVHRTLHIDAATTRGLDDRETEDKRMLVELWPAPIARLLGYVYSASRRPYRTMRERT